MRICDGPGKEHHFANFSQHGLGRGCLVDHFGKSEAKGKTSLGICGFVMVLARVIILPTFPNAVWEGIDLGTILEKWKPKETPYHVVFCLQLDTPVLRSAIDVVVTDIQ